MPRMVARKSGKAAFQFGFELTNIMLSEGGTEIELESPQEKPSRSRLMLTRSIVLRRVTLPVTTT